MSFAGFQCAWGYIPFLLSQLDSLLSHVSVSVQLCINQSHSCRQLLRQPSLSLTLKNGIWLLTFTEELPGSWAHRGMPHTDCKGQCSDTMTKEHDINMIVFVFDGFHDLFYFWHDKYLHTRETPHWICILPCLLVISPAALPRSWQKPVPLFLWG